MVKVINKIVRKNLTEVLTIILPESRTYVYTLSTFTQIPTTTATILATNFGNG